MFICNTAYFVFKQLSNQAQPSVDGDNSLPSEPNWAMRQHGRENILMSTPPPPDMFVPTEPRIQSPQRQSTPPPYEVYTQNDTNLRATPPLNPWNPYLRSYGRVYPYGLHANQYENEPRNWGDSIRDERTPRSLLSHYQIGYLPVIRTQISFGTVPNVDDVRRNLVRTRPNRVFLYRGVAHAGANAENHSGCSNLPVIEISSDEEEARSLPVDFSRITENNSDTAHPSFNRSSRNKENILIHSRLGNVTSSPTRRTPVESKPNIQTHSRRTSSDGNISSTANHHHHHQHHNHQTDDGMNVNSRIMKRPHRHSPYGPIKQYRDNNECRHSRLTPENIESHTTDEQDELANRKPNVNEIDNNVNSTNANTSQAVITDENIIERKFKIRIKSEFKIEPSNNNSEHVDNEIVVDTKEPLQSLIADIKQE